LLPVPLSWHSWRRVPITSNRHSASSHSPHCGSRSGFHCSKTSVFVDSSLEVFRSIRFAVPIRYVSSKNIAMVLWIVSVTGCNLQCDRCWWRSKTANLTCTAIIWLLFPRESSSPESKHEPAGYEEEVLKCFRKRLRLDATRDTLLPNARAPARRLFYAVCARLKSFQGWTPQTEGRTCACTSFTDKVFDATVNTTFTDNRSFIYSFLLAALSQPVFDVCSTFCHWPFPFSLAVYYEVLALSARLEVSTDVEAEPASQPAIALRVQ